MPVTQTDDGKYECPKCHEKLDTPRALSNHIVKTHKMATRAFYDEYVKTPTEGTCAVCGTPTKYRDLMVGYKTTCSHKCGSILLKNDAEKMALKKAHTEATSMARYGVKNGGGSAQALQKSKETNLAKRGVEYAMQDPAVKQKTAETFMDRYDATTYLHSTEGEAAVKATCAEKFGAENFFGSEQGKKAVDDWNYKEYGTRRKLQNEEHKAEWMAEQKAKYNGKMFVQTDEFKEKSRETQDTEYGGWYSASPEGRANYQKIMLEQRGVPEYFQSEEFKGKSKATNLEKRGVEYISQSQEWKDKCEATSLEHWNTKHPSQSPVVQAKMRETSMENWNVPNPMQSSKLKQQVIDTNMAKYNAPHYMQSQQYKDSIISKYIPKMTEFNCNNPVIDGQLIRFHCNSCGNDCAEYHQYVHNRMAANITPCPYCMPKQMTVSLEESGLTQFIESLGVSVAHYDANFLDTYGADIVIEDQKLIIEYDGLYWHSELYKDNNYHLRKRILAEQKGYRLVHLFSDEWIYHRSIVEARLRYLLHKWIGDTVYARDCQITNVKDDDAEKFLDSNHLQGNVHAHWNYGLVHNGELVAIMTFGNNRFGDGIEMYRYCSRIDVSVVGGASRLFKHFITENKDVEKITTFADARWSTSDAFYTKLGFVLDGMSHPGYFIIDGDIRRNRVHYQKHKIAGPNDEGKTEHEITLERKLYRIYDCGQLRYVWNR